MKFRPFGISISTIILKIGSGQSIWSGIDYSPDPILITNPIAFKCIQFQLNWSISDRTDERNWTSKNISQFKIFKN